MTRAQVVLAVLTIGLSGVAAAVVSVWMTGRLEREKALLDRRLTAAGDFAGAAARASNALDELAHEVRVLILPRVDQMPALYELADQVDDEISTALEHAGLIRVLYGPSTETSTHATVWANRSRRAVAAARAYLHVIQPRVDGHTIEASVADDRRGEVDQELQLAREARHEFETTAAKAAGSP
jgi:ribosomal protein L25 (general stress protein Ctc)